MVSYLDMSSLYSQSHFLIPPSLFSIVPYSSFIFSVYANSPEAFNDVVLGDNACGAGGGLETVNCCDVAFSALPGWDAVTGLGSPNFQVK